MYLEPSFNRIAHIDQVSLLAERQTVIKTIICFENPSFFFFKFTQKYTPPSTSFIINLHVMLSYFSNIQAMELHYLYIRYKRCFVEVLQEYLHAVISPGSHFIMCHDHGLCLLAKVATTPLLMPKCNAKSLAQIVVALDNGVASCGMEGKHDVGEDD